jgi:putative ABC transport system permease protein
LVGLLTGVVRFGFAAFSHLSGVDVLISVSLATLAGFVLSLLGVLYPAILAARMRPVMALRAEH